MTDGDADDGGIDILSKAGSIVDALAAEPLLSVSALAETVGEPTSSTYRLLQSLTAMGWVEAAPLRGMYRLGLAFMQIGGLLEDSLDVRSVAMPRMRALRSAADAATLLCYRRGTRAVCVERIEGHDVRSVAMQVGDSLPLHVGGAPRALLAFLPEGERRAVLESLRARAGDIEHPLPPADAIAEDVDRTLAQGYARSDEDVTIGIAAFGSPVFNHRGELVAALSISGLRESLVDREPELSAMLVATAAAISADLGHEEGSDG